MFCMEGIKEMKLLTKLKEKKDKLKKDYDRGTEVTQQMKADKIRKKMKKAKDNKPGAIKAISEGMAFKKSPLDVMKEEYERRKYEREQKHKDD